jgi:hypothetical protein
VRRMAAARTMRRIAASSIKPCCWSMHSQSQPEALTISAVKALGIMHQPPKGGAAAVYQFPHPSAKQPPLRARLLHKTNYLRCRFRLYVQGNYAGPIPLYTRYHHCWDPLEAQALPTLTQRSLIS